MLSVVIRCYPLLSVVILLVLASCEKETISPDPEVVFSEYQFIPESEATAKAVVTEFISTLADEESEVSFRSDFADTEVNEARWILEGSANYLKNMNFDDKVMTHVENYSFVVSNATAGNMLKMRGSDMTAKMNQFLSEVTAEENSSASVAMAVDIQLESVTSSSSQLRAAVVFGKSKGGGTGGGGITWAEGAMEVSTGTLNQLINVGQGCIEWIPETFLFQWTLGNEEINCLPTGTPPITICLSSGPNTSDYNPALIPSDVTNAIIMGNHFVDQANQLPGGAAPAVPYSLKGVLIGSSFNSSNRFLFLSSVIARGYSYCY